MFKKSFQQYIDIIKYNNQMKLNFKRVEDSIIVKKDQNIFLLKEELLHKDISFKIHSWKKDNPNSTFVSTILTSPEQIILKNSDEIDKNNYVIAKLDENNKVAIKNHQLFEIKHYFMESPLDRLYSPFHVITQFCEKNDSQDSLIVFIYDNFLYMIFYGDNSEIKDFKIEPMIKYEDIQESEFYEDEISRQKLYDEYYSLYFNNIINEKIKEFYNEHDSVFVQKVVILYNVKHLSDEDIEELENDLMISVNSYAISLDDYIYNISSSKEADVKSLISEPKKTSNNNFKKMVGLFVATVIVILGLVAFFVTQTSDEKPNQEQTTIEDNQTKVSDDNVTILLPNHISLNRTITKRILNEFDLIPYNALLKEAIFTQKNSTLKLDLIDQDSYSKDMYPTLSKMYDQTTIEFENTKDEIFKANIKNIDMHDVDNSSDENITKATPNYKEGQIIDSAEISSHLKSLFNADSIVVFSEGVDSKKLNIAVFRISTILNNPAEFFDLVEKINNQPYSMVIDYPISFRMSELGLEIDFILKFYQQNK